MISSVVQQRQAQPRLCLCLEQLEMRNLPSSVQPLSLLDTSYSYNWSGYVAETNLSSPASDAVTMVSGSWTVPTVTGNTTAYSAVWVGIDGYSSPTVEQIGTEQDTSSSGATRYYAWWEMYPAASVQITTMRIRPGDTISASVGYNSGSFTLQITDADGQQSFSIVINSLASAARSSAEWIVEAPSSITGILPLANFGKVNFSEAQATIKGTTGPIDNSSWQNTAIDMVSRSGTVLDLTSGLTDTNNTSSFTVTYTGSSSGSGGGGGRHHGHGPNDLMVVGVLTQSGIQAPANAITSQAAESPTASAGQELILPAPADAFFAQVHDRWSGLELNTGPGFSQSGITDLAGAWEIDGVNSSIPGEE